jgi:hypothetical protein
LKAVASKRVEPLRLLRKRGSWSVEYTRLVSVDEHILRPERRRSPATADLLRSLGESCPPERLNEAVALMHHSDDGSELAFELREDGWREAPTATPSQRPLAQGDLRATLTETTVQLAVLRGLYDALLARVLALESAEAQAQRSLPPRVVRRVPSRKSMLDSLRHGPRIEEARPVPVFSPPAPRVAEAAALAPSRLAAPEPGPPPPEPAKAAAPSPDATLASPGASSLSTPSSDDVVGCLQMLAADVAITKVRANAPTELADFYVALLGDESGEPIAALLFNRRAAAELGAGILSASIAERDEQAQNGLSSDSLDGLNEVANNLTGLVNRTNPKRQVRLGALERAPASAPAWLVNPAKKQAYSLRENGALFLLVR